MQYRKLGHSELEVPAIIFGAWAIGGWFWGETDEQDAVEAIRAGIEEGVTCVDTAPIYGAGHSEEVVGRALKGRRDRAIIATKCGLRWDLEEGQHYFRTSMPAVGEVTVCKNLKPDSIRHECEQSLMRLQTDYIDLYQYHWPDETTSLDDTMAALLDLQRQGKVREIGVSNFTPEMIDQCLRKGRVASTQPKYNLLERHIEEDILPYAREKGLGVIVYSPLAQGLLTGKVAMDREFREGDMRAGQLWFRPVNRQKVLDALDQVQPLAAKHGCSLAQLSLAWTIAQPGVTSAIVGARDAAQVKENAAAAGVSLSKEELAQIRAAFEAVQPEQ